MQPPEPRNDSDSRAGDSPVCTIEDGGYQLEVGRPTGTIVVGESPEPDVPPGEGRTRPQEVENAVDRAASVTGQVEKADALYRDLADGSLELSQAQASIDTLISVLGRLDREGRYEEALRVARTLSKLLTLARRWAALIQALLSAQRAGEVLGKPEAIAWAKHEIGTAEMVVGDLRAADRELEKARRIREEIGDRRGLAATDRNLQGLCRHMRRLMRENKLVQRRGFFRPAVLSPVLLAGMALVLLAAGGVAAGVIDGASESGTKMTNGSNDPPNGNRDNNGGGPGENGGEGGGEGGGENGGRGENKSGGGNGDENGNRRGGGDTEPLLVELAGEGSGTVISDPPGIECPGHCEEDFAADQEVTLVAAEDDRAIFAGFSKNCPGDGATCTIVAPATVTATFDAESVELTITLGREGPGLVTSSPPGISCSTHPTSPRDQCSYLFQVDAVTLSAKTQSEFTEFRGFSGELTESCPAATCTVSMDRDRVVGATFIGE